MKRETPPRDESIISSAGGSHAALKRTHNREACRDRFCEALRWAQHDVAASAAAAPGAAAAAAAGAGGALPGVPEQGPQQPPPGDGRGGQRGGSGGSSGGGGGTHGDGRVGMRDVLVQANADVLPWLADFFSFKLLEVPFLLMLVPSLFPIRSVLSDFTRLRCSELTTRLRF